MHDLGRLLEATTFLPPAWRDAMGPGARPYPFWWAIERTAILRLAELGIPWAFPAPGSNAEEQATPVKHRLLERQQVLWYLRLSKALAGRPKVEGPADVLLHIPHRMWADERAWEVGRNRYVAPLAEELRRRGKRLVTTMPFPTLAASPVRRLAEAWRRGPPKGAEHTWLDSHWDATARQAFHQAADFWAGATRDLAAVRNLGFDLPDGPAGERFAHWLRRMDLRVAFMAALVVAGARMMRRVRPRAFVAMVELVPYTRSLGHAARCLGIPYVALQHGWMGPRYLWYHKEYASASPTTPAAVQAAMPDRLAVFGPAQREMLEAGGYPPGFAVVTGCLRHDAIAAEDRGALRKRLAAGLAPPPDAARPWVLWATQTHGFAAAENQANAQAVAGLLGQGWEVFVKLHPMEDQRAPDYRRLLAEGARLLDGRAPMLEWIQACDVLVTKHSTVGMEAAALDRPVVVLNPTGGPAGDYASSGMASEARDAGSLRREVALAVSEPGRRRRERLAYARRSLGEADGKAGARVADLLEGLAAGRAEAKAPGRPLANRVPDRPPL